MEIDQDFHNPEGKRDASKTLLDRVQKYKSFVYTDVMQLMEKNRLILLIKTVPRLNRQPKCSHCRQPGPGYDIFKSRQFELIPLWGMPVFFYYVMIRCDCPHCGVVVESVPWADK